jgi:POT family proton-dependent oligopeptide transporter
MNDQAIPQKHPPGLWVLFSTEMWERFGFYSMLAMFTIYLQNKDQGLGWSKEQAFVLYSNYLMFVYASPLIGGWIADRGLGYRNSVLIGGVIFMVGYFLLAVRSEPIVYLALTCLVVGNGFFKPNVSAMVGHLYPEGSPLKDRAFNIFYMGINIGALAAPLNAGLMVKAFGFHPAFAVAGVGMIISVIILWTFQRYVVPPKESEESPASAEETPATAVTADIPPAAPAPRKAMDDVPDWMRITALLVIFVLVIVFWMVFHQNGSTLTDWARENTDWTVVGLPNDPSDEGITGIISNAINPFWVITLTFPLVFFWKWLDQRGLEPSTPAKIALGMLLTAGSFLLLYLAARTGEAAPGGDAVGKDGYKYLASPFWLISSYAVVTLGELMLSPMGLSLVSKVAPVKVRGLMMGGWFVATAIGNKLTAIGVFWDQWLHSTFFALLGGMSLFMAVILLILLKPLKKAMPGV